jgi:hypothetical protein
MTGVSFRCRVSHLQITATVTPFSPAISSIVFPSRVEVDDAHIHLDLLGAPLDDISKE